MHITKSYARFQKQDIFDDYKEKVLLMMCDILKDYVCNEDLMKILEKSMISSGKMIRSYLLISTSLTNKNNLASNIIKQCAVVEITHLASLLHDDIIDDSVLRRGYPSIQSSYGKDVAVFAGDYMIAGVFNFLARNKLNKESIIISNTILDMCNGEVGQNLAKYDENVNEENYFINISNKTASFFKSSCQIGAINAGLDDTMTKMMMTFGQNLGLIFQLRDDLMDIFSTSLEMGKDVFKDFKEGIYTYPVIAGLKNDAYRKKILNLIKTNKTRPLEEEEYEKLKNYLADAGSYHMTIYKIRQLSEENENILSKMSREKIPTEELEKILSKIGDVR